MGQTRINEFGQIDQTNDPGYFIRFLDAACAEASFQAYKQRMNYWLGLPGAVRILDMGCGTGDDARQMAALVSGAGQVVGVDNSQAMIAEARQRAAGLNLPVAFQTADALALPFETASFDGCRADRSPMHLPDIHQALREMARVTNPGGAVVVYEVDFETLVIDADERGLARKVVNSWCDSFRNGWLGRHMPALFRELGIKDLTIEPYTLRLTPELAWPLLGSATVERAIERGTLTAAEGTTWLNHVAELQQTGRFFCTLTGFLVAGKK